MGIAQNTNEELRSIHFRQATCALTRSRGQMSGLTIAAYCEHVGAVCAFGLWNVEGVKDDLLSVLSTALASHVVQVLEPLCHALSELRPRVGWFRAIGRVYRLLATLEGSKVDCGRLRGALSVGCTLDDVKCIVLEYQNHRELATQLCEECSEVLRLIQCSDVDVSKKFSPSSANTEWLATVKWVSDAKNGNLRRDVRNLSALYERTQTSSAVLEPIVVQIDEQLRASAALDSVDPPIWPMAPAVTRTSLSPPQPLPTNPAMFATNYPLKSVAPRAHLAHTIFAGDCDSDIACWLRANKHSGTTPRGLVGSVVAGLEEHVAYLENQLQCCGGWRPLAMCECPSCKQVGTLTMGHGGLQCSACAHRPGMTRLPNGAIVCACDDSTTRQCAVGESIAFDMLYASSPVQAITSNTWQANNLKTLEVLVTPGDPDHTPVTRAVTHGGLCVLIQHLLATPDIRRCKGKPVATLSFSDRWFRDAGRMCHIIDKLHNLIAANHTDALYIYRAMRAQFHAACTNCFDGLLLSGEVYLTRWADTLALSEVPRPKRGDKRVALGHIISAYSEAIPSRCENVSDRGHWLRAIIYCLVCNATASSCMALAFAPELHIVGETAEQARSVRENMNTRSVQLATRVSRTDLYCINGQCCTHGGKSFDSWELFAQHMCKCSQWSGRLPPACLTVASWRAMFPGTPYPLDSVDAWNDAAALGRVEVYDEREVREEHSEWARRIGYCTSDEISADSHKLHRKQKQQIDDDITRLLETLLQKFALLVSASKGVAYKLYI